MSFDALNVAVKPEFFSTNLTQMPLRLISMLDLISVTKCD